MLNLWRHEGWLLEATDCPDMHDGLYRAWVSNPERVPIGYGKGPGRYIALSDAIDQARAKGAPFDVLNALCIAVSAD